MSDASRNPTLAGIRSMIGALALAAAVGAPLQAQSPGGSPNQGAITFTGGLDTPTVYFFRGILQEGDPRITLWPGGDLRVALAAGDGGLKSVAVHVGVWNSLHTGTAGTGGPLNKLHYQEDFSAGLNLDLAHGLGVATTFVARTSPNGSFNSITELDIKVAKAGRIAPYGMMAFELSDTGQADGGSKRGTYLELGAAPSVALRVARARLTVPVKVGLSVKNYYELLNTDLTYRDSTFGFFDIGGLVAIPLSRATSRFGEWNVHGGADLVALGDTTRAFNRGNKTRIVGQIGIGVTY
ncbi:MAG: hypothetical protein ABJA98_26780 [Acidobacteriota bacterium]